MTFIAVPGPRNRPTRGRNGSKCQPENDVKVSKLHLCGYSLTEYLKTRQAWDWNRGRRSAFTLLLAEEEWPAEGSAISIPAHFKELSTPPTPRHDLLSSDGCRTALCAHAAHNTNLGKGDGGVFFFFLSLVPEVKSESWRHQGDVCSSAGKLLERRGEEPPSIRENLKLERKKKKQVDPSWLGSQHAGKLRLLPERKVIK